MRKGLLNVGEFCWRAANDGSTSLKAFENVSNPTSILVSKRLASVHTAFTTE